MVITLDKFQSNIQRYFLLAKKEDVEVVDKGVKVATISSPQNSLTAAEKDKIAEAITGMIPNDISLEEARIERLGRQ